MEGKERGGPEKRKSKTWHDISIDIPGYVSAWSKDNSGLVARWP